MSATLPIRLQSLVQASLLAACVVLPVLLPEAGTPAIEFEKTTLDFGRTSSPSALTGIFKFKNIGDEVLKLQPPEPSCGCTTAGLKQDSYPPGATGELAVSLQPGLVSARFDKQILIRSNDPVTPEVRLHVRADFTPIHELIPNILSPVLASGINVLEQFSTLTRNDGQPLVVARLTASKPWIQASLVQGAAGPSSSARIRVVLQREGLPRRFTEFVQIYSDTGTNSPIASIQIYGRFMGDVSLIPEALYWSFVNSPAVATPRVGGDLFTRRIVIRSAAGDPIQVSNLRSTLEGIHLELVAREGGKAHELIARLDAVPPVTLSGNVSFETSSAAQPLMEVPVIVNVSKP